MRPPHPQALLLFLLLLLGACSKKDPNHLSKKRWAKRNIECARKSINALVAKLEKRSREAEQLGARLSALLNAKECPMGTHIECSPELGVQAVATFISRAAISSSTQTPKKGVVVKETAPSRNELLKELVQKHKARTRVRGNIPALPKEEKGEGIKGGTLHNEALGISPEELAQKSRCGVKVTQKCTFKTIDMVVAELALFAKQAQLVEWEVGKILSIGSANPYANSVEKLYQGMRSLEANIQELTTLEEAVLVRKRKEYKERYNRIKPLVIKGIVIDLAKNVPTSIAARLKNYIPQLKKVLKGFDERRDAYEDKLGAALRALPRSKRQNGNTCLEKSGCWQFRSCVKRYRLPTISVFK